MLSVGVAIFTLVTVSANDALGAGHRHHHHPQVYRVGTAMSGSYSPSDYAPPVTGYGGRGYGGYVAPHHHHHRGW